MDKLKLGTVWIIEGSDACFTSYEGAKRFQEECNSNIDCRDVDDEDIQPYELFAYVLPTFDCQDAEEQKEPTALSERLSIEVFGEMRHLTPEENVRKLEMYRNMSTVVAGAKMDGKE